MPNDKTGTGTLQWEPNQQGVQFLIDREKIEPSCWTSSGPSSRATGQSAAIPAANQIVDLADAYISQYDPI